MYDHWNIKIPCNYNSWWSILAKIKLTKFRVIFGSSCSKNVKIWGSISWTFGSVHNYSKLLSFAWKCFSNVWLWIWHGLLEMQHPNSIVAFGRDAYKIHQISRTDNNFELNDARNEDMFSLHQSSSLMQNQVSFHPSIIH